MFPLGKVYTGDCVQLIKQLPHSYIDLTVTSPPYDNLRKYNGYSFDFEKTAVELYRVTKSGGVVVWVVGDATVKGSETGTSFKQALYFMSCGFNLHDTMIYEKIGLTLNHNRYEQEFEYMFVLSKGKPKTFTPLKVPCIWYGKDSDRTGQNYGTHEEKNKKLRSGKSRGNINPEKIKGNIWRYNVGFGHTTKDPVFGLHHAMYPEKLAEDHILSWSNPGDLIFDPFSGSGTTGKMALLNNRKFLGFEISEEYTTLANNRIRNTVYDGL